VSKDANIDLKEAARLVAALQRDLRNVSHGAGDLQQLRDEVHALEKLLQSGSAGQGHVRDALHRVQSALQHGMQAARGEAGADWPYLAEIGRILGLP
jgi:hypothetical protein